MQQGLITAEVLAVTTGLQSLANWSVSRERPYGRDCDGPVLAGSRECLSNGRRYRSFFSGHTSQAFAAASANCMHHGYVPLYGGGAADDWACAAGLGIALGTGLLRMRTDVHYASDVAVGAVVGTAVGLGLPYFLHYRHGSADDSGSSRYRLLVVPTGTGLSGLLVF